MESHRQQLSKAINTLFEGLDQCMIENTRRGILKDKMHGKASGNLFLSYQLDT